jgi:hypothetical protein
MLLAPLPCLCVAAAAKQGLEVLGVGSSYYFYPTGLLKKSFVRLCANLCVLSGKI